MQVLWILIKEILGKKTSQEIKQKDHERNPGLEFSMYLQGNASQAHWHGTPFCFGQTASSLELTSRTFALRSIDSRYLHMP